MPNGLFKNKYRIESSRLPDYDYTWNGWYFVTICTYEKHHFFGDIVNGKMVLNDLGKMADKYWQKITTHFPFVKSDQYVVMPNHVHGIVHIKRDDDYTTRGGCATCRDEACLVSTDAAKTTSPLIPPNAKKYNTPKPGISPKSGSLSAIIGSYKSTITRESKFITPYFHWQSRFYDKIIHNDHSLNNIRQYIIENPEKWERDRNNIGIWM